MDFSPPDGLDCPEGVCPAVQRNSPSFVPMSKGNVLVLSQCLNSKYEGARSYSVLAPLYKQASQTCPVV